ncbi:MAG TPA: mechanosensitive ion channel domain-containing protein [Rhizomicrobium sp.]|nr:mechanosensitive ion channel domain-containing protein [Rhizomicrobium sp.]
MRNLARTAVVPAFILAALLWAVALVTESDPVLGVGLAHAVLRAAAIVASAVLAVIVAGKLLLGMAASFTGTPATGFQRVIIYGLLTFAASFATLRYFGFDLTAVLTTSAIVTAAVGFAMQPTLSSMIAGLALHADRAVRVGDCILLDNETVRIESMNWRAAIGRRPDGRLIVVPNAKLTEALTDVLRADEAHRAEFSFFGPLDHPPQQICELVRELVSDLALVDKSRPIAVAPTAFDPQQESVRFRIFYWTRSYWERPLIEGEIVRRIWYSFQRNRIAFPHPTACAISASTQGALEQKLQDPVELMAQVARVLRPEFLPDAAEAIAKNAQLLLFAPDERIVMPEWSDGWRYLLLRGEAYEVPEFDLTPEVTSAGSQLAVERLGPTAAITRLADDLSLIIGPYAKLAVVRAGDRTQTYEQLCREVAQEIEDPRRRQIFLDKMLATNPRRWSPGAVIAVRRNASGQLASEPSLRAHGEVALLGIPAELMDRLTSSPPRIAAAGA